MKPDSGNSYSSSQQSSYNNGNSCGNRIRVIKLRRRNSVPLGFSVRGGREHGTGIYVSEVRGGSEAHHQGLLVGDQILRINGFNIEHAIHEEVLALLRAKPGVVIKVKSMGVIPVKDTKKDPLTWRIVEPGPSLTDSSTTTNCSELDETNFESRISIPAIGASGLGCSIVKGPPDVPGIYVQSVKAGSLAEKAGLQVGDRIMEMNGHNFTNLDFPDAVAVLKSSKQMTLFLLKGAGLDLFPEEKLRRSRQTENKKLSSVEEESSRDERDTKGMNGHNSRCINGSDSKHLPDDEFQLNGNSSGSDSERSHCADIVQESINFSHNLKVHATVHISSGEDNTPSSIRKAARESGDGMDFESLNGNQNQRKDNCLQRDDGNFEANLEAAVESATAHSWCINNGNAQELFSSNQSPKTALQNRVINEKLLAAIQSNEHGDKRSITSDEKSELSSLSSDDYLGIPKLPTGFRRNAHENNEENTKPPNEFLKRKQHELLMEEFREVHKKMFGHGPAHLTTSSREASLDHQEHTNLYKRRQQVRKDRVTPPPPPPSGAIVYEKVEMNNFSANENFGGNFYADDDDDEEENIAYKRRQREPPITDSRDPEPKPPETYFDKPGNRLKPLVTIGTYSNCSNQNRFLNSVINQKTIQLKKTGGQLNSQSSKIKEGLNLNVHKRSFTSSTSSTVPSSSSSEPRSPTSDSLTSSDSLFHSNSPPAIRGNTKSQVPLVNGTVPNTFQKSLSQFSKMSEKTNDIAEKDKKPNSTEKSSCVLKSNQQSVNQRTHPEKKVLERDADGREMKTLILKKNGPLNFAIEGGINSELGKIIVSEVWLGSCVIEGGHIELGDQILMVDDTRLTGLSLTAANVALRNANSTPNKEMTLIIAKSPKEEQK